MVKSDLDTHWNKIYLHQEKDFRSANLNTTMLRLIPKSGSVLDVGCGTCAQTIALLRRGYDVYAIDSSKSMVRNAREVLRNAGFSDEIVHHVDLFKIPSDQKVDIIVCLDVLEHIKDDYKAFESLCNALNKNGKILISVPALKSLYYRRDREIGHYRRYGKGRLISLFNSCNLKIEKIKNWNFIGILPVLISIMKDKRVNEGFRYNQDRRSKFINNLLYLWFKFIENNIDIGIGLTLFCVGRKI